MPHRILTGINMMRKNVTNELVEAMREAAAIVQGESAPAATHHFPLPLDADGRSVLSKNMSRKERAVYEQAVQAHP